MSLPEKEMLNRVDLSSRRNDINDGMVLTDDGRTFQARVAALYAVCQFQYIFITRKLCQPFTWYFLSHFRNYTLSSFLPFVTVVLCDWIVELLEHVSLESHEYVTEILQTIQRSYKDGSSKAQFRYTRPRLVHNSRLQDNVSHVWFWSWISQA